MKKTVLLLLILITEVSLYAQLQPSEDMRGWTVLFEDDMTSFNTNLWYKEYYSTHGDGTNEEPQIYVQDNVTNSNGKLVLTAHPVNVSLPHPNNGSCNYNNQHHCTSGQICSNATYQYGYFEIYAKLPAVVGAWPAFWFWQSNDSPSDPWYNEIDVFEGDGSNAHFLTHNIWYDFSYPIHEVQRGNKSFQCNYAQGYHWYGIKWDKNRIMWYCDRHCVREDLNIYGGYGIQHHMNIIINLALKIGTTMNSTYSMYVDQVNAYQLDCSDKNVVQNEISDFSTYNYKVKKSITLSGATTLPANGNIVLYATDYVRLNAGFSVPLGTEFTIDTCDECN